MILQCLVPRLDKVIDTIGDEVADYDCDGLRAFAHLGGKSGMKKFVQSNSDYNPSDDLENSLSNYGNELFS